MGHYMDIAFDAPLSKTGADIFRWLEGHEGGWRAAAEWFSEFKFVEDFEANEAELITRSPHSSYKPDTRGSVFTDGPAGTRWTVCTCFKWRGGRVDDALLDFLRYVIAEPVEVSLRHELWDKPRLVTVQPAPPPEPDWDRKYGD